MKHYEFSGISEVFRFWMLKTMIWHLFSTVWRKVRKTQFLRRNRLARDVFTRFPQNCQEFPFVLKPYVIIRKMHLQTYGVGNDFLCDHQTSKGFLAKNAGFCILGLKSQNCDFHENRFGGPNHNFRPRPPTINNSQGILMVWGVAGAGKCEIYLNSMILMEISWNSMENHVLVEIHVVG